MTNTRNLTMPCLMFTAATLLSALAFVMRLQGFFVAFKGFLEALKPAA